MSSTTDNPTTAPFDPVTPAAVRAAAATMGAAAQWVWHQERELALLAIAAWAASGLALWLL